MVRSRVQNTCNILGLTIGVQSATYSPIYIHKVIIDFLDKFYNELFTEECFNKYKKGFLDLKKLPHRDISSEANALVKKLISFNRQPDSGIDWGQKAKEIDHIENNCSYQELRDFYKSIFNPGQSKEYLAIRVFSTKFVSEISYSTLEKLARRGELLPAIGHFTTYMYSYGNVSKEDALIMLKTQVLQQKASIQAE